MQDLMLSIIVPCVGGRIDRVKAIISRLTLNQHLHPDIPFELIVVDGSKTAEYRELCEFGAQYLKLKYIAVPIGQFINAGYPRNIGMRVAQGKVLAGIDIDYWIGEHLIAGATEAFRKNQLALSRGYVIDTNKSNRTRKNEELLEQLNNALLSNNNMDKEILDVYRVAEIPMPKVWDKIWLWSAPTAMAHKIGGYDEIYCRQGAYSREDDSWFYRLAKIIPVYNDAYNTFVAIHLWHPAAQRHQSANNLNKEYYVKMGADNPISVVRNVDRQWGKMLKYSFSIIDGTIRNPEAHEEWIYYNTDLVDYLDSPEWESLQSFFDELEQYAEKK